jgi:hypothetical protein
MSNFVTPNGKEISIVNQKGTGHYKIQFNSGGELPENLSGLYTSVSTATIAVVQYISTLEAKAKKTTKEE